MSAELARKFLTYSFTDIKFNYDGLTEAERWFCTREEFDALVTWIKGAQPMIPRHVMPTGLDEKQGAKWLRELPTTFPCEIEVDGVSTVFHEKKQLDGYIEGWEAA